MARDLAAVATEGVEACLCGDHARVASLVAELLVALDLEHAAARPVCDLYEEVLRELRDGRVEAARALFHALRSV